MERQDVQVVAELQGRQEVVASQVSQDQQLMKVHQERRLPQ